MDMILSRNLSSSLIRQSPSLCFRLGCHIVVPRLLKEKVARGTQVISELTLLRGGKGTVAGEVLCF